MTVSSRYGARAAEYCEALGSLDQMEPTDIALIKRGAHPCQAVFLMPDAAPGIGRACSPPQTGSSQA